LTTPVNIKTLGIIPSRYASTRFPGKPLALLGKKPVIQWVYERSAPVLDAVFVATDDSRIFKTVRDFGGDVVMTSDIHRSGTDRCAEALNKVESIKKIQYDIVVNIQGDEPFIDPGQIRKLVSLFNDPAAQIATLAGEISREDDIFDPNKPKLVVDSDNFAMLFSRSPIPFVRDAERGNWHLRFRFLRHIGIYAFLPEVLRKITTIPPSELEITESLEQLRWLQNGFRIKVGITNVQNVGIDTPEDLEEARKMIRSGMGGNV
jgi:3-deoxy-manno-octulosonate cytidylyltransferase (CMP-KDO synthetase)